MHALGLEHDLEHGHEVRGFGRIAAGYRAVPARHRLDVLGRVVGLPRLAIDLLELRVAHLRMMHAAVMHVVLVEVGVHPDALLPQGLVILRAGQRREHEQLEDIERQLLLDDFHVAQDRFARVAREAQDVAGPGRGTAVVPRLQHLAVLGDLVLALLGGQQIVRIDVFQADEDAIDARPARLVDEVRDAVALGVDLDDQRELDALVLLQLDEPVEEVFPMLVAGHVVVGDEERRDALLVVLADDRFEIVGGAEPALATLHVDDGAERALERAAAAEIEARHAALVARQRRRRQMRRGGAFEARQIVHVVVERLHRAVHRVAQHEVEPAFLGLAGEDRDAHIHGFLDLGRHHRQHRQAARHVEATDRHRQASQLQELAGEVDGVRELVGLDADEADQAHAAAALDLGQKPVGADTGIGLVDRVDDDVDVGSQHVAGLAVLTESIEGGQGIGGNV